jgi:hypothetical protein
MPKVYDVKIDEFREATQEDVDVLQAGVNAYVQLHQIFFHQDGVPKRHLDDGICDYWAEDTIEAARVIHQRFRDQVKLIREKKNG